MHQAVKTYWSPGLADSSAGGAVSRKIRVLCVDDCSRVRGAWSRLLSMQPDMMTVASIERGDQLIDALVQHSPDVVLLDLSLSDGSAYDVIQAALQHQPNARMLVYSGHSDQATIDRCAQIGTWGFVGKDADPEIVLDSIRRIHAGEAVFHRSAMSR